MRALSRNDAGSGAIVDRHRPAHAGMGITAAGPVAQAKGIVACTEALILTGLPLLLRVVTFSVTWTVTEVGAASFLFGVPDNTPVEDSLSPLGRVTFFHLSVVAWGLVLEPRLVAWRVTGP